MGVAVVWLVLSLILAAYQGGIKASSIVRGLIFYRTSTLVVASLYQ